MTISPIQFTQEQARTATGIPPETLRHWRKLVPYLAHKSGKAARFTFSDLVGLTVTYELIQTFGISIGTARAAVDQLFRVLGDSQPSVFESGVIVLTATTAKLYRIDQALKWESLGPTVIVSCGPLARRVQERVLPGVRVDQQRSLPFLPRAVRSRR
jgi:hypothetical protein